MRQLIRSKVTKAFLTDVGAWTPNIADAATFCDQEAAETKLRLKLQQVELYYCFGEQPPSQWDFAIRL